MEFLMTEYASDSNEDDTEIKLDVTKCAKTKTLHGPVSSNVDGESRTSVIKDKVKDSTKATNYFGLPESSDDSDTESVKTSSNAEKPVSKVVHIGDAAVNVEIPNTSFWNEASNMDIQAFQHREIDTHFPNDPMHSFGKSVGASQSEKRSFNTSKMSIHESRASKICKHDRTEKSEKSYKMVNSGPLTDKHSERKLYFIHPKITPLLHTKCPRSKLPHLLEWSQTAHTGAVNRVRWCSANYCHLFASCSMDSVVKVWNIWSQLDPCVKVLSSHKKAVKDVVWSRDGKQLLTASYDRTAAVTDVEKGVSVCQLDHSSYVTCARYHPVNPHLCITGEHNQILTWDTRRPQVPTQMFTYKDSIGQVQDLLFSDDSSTLFSCSDFVTRDSADRNVMAWDFATGVVLSNQIYQERYTVTRLKGHSSDGQFLAQSQGDYIAIFSMKRPYKMCKHKRFEGHKLLGYSIGFDVTPDGQTVYSGSSNGKVYSYNYQTGRAHSTLDTGMHVVMDVACHPLLPSTLVAGSWDGTIQVWK